MEVTLGNGTLDQTADQSPVTSTKNFLLLCLYTCCTAAAAAGETAASPSQQSGSI